jgi:hypothetical protein
MPACFASINKGLFLSIMVLMVQGTGGRVHMLYWNASNPLLGGEESGRLAVNTNPEDQQYDQVYYKSFKIIHTFFFCKLYFLDFRVLIASNGGFLRSSSMLLLSKKTPRIPV